MRQAMTATICIAVLLVSVFSAVAQNKEEKLTGKVTCAKCDLKIEKECATVIVAREGGKDVTYYLDEKSHKANHDAICQGGKEGTVTGTVSEKGGKKFVTASKVELKK
jgi:hypothetical protein